MPINYPKFEKRITDKIEDNKFTSTKNRPGTIMMYDSIKNTATVLIDEKFSDNIGTLLPNVKCPFVYGVQTVAPSPGTRCMVGFRDEHEDSAYVLMYFNVGHSHKNIRNSILDTCVPKFMA
jgi:hypothetical protein